MGNKRYGFLPKSKAWRVIVKEMGEFALEKKSVDEIAFKTLRQVRDRFTELQNDPSIKSTFELLLHISYAFKQNDPISYLSEKELLEKKEVSVVDLSRAIWNNKSEEINSKEYETVAKQAAIDALNGWYKQNIERGRSFFQEGIDQKAIFYKTNDGSGFCELARLYFSKFTERYLKYYLEREASIALPNPSQRKKFTYELESHIDEVSKHAFQTAKITESFAAGWYNKYVTDEYPEEADVRWFLNKAFGKIKSDLLQEEMR